MEARTREQRRIVEASVVEAVGEHRSAVVEQRRNDAESRHVAGRKEQGARHSDELCEPPLQCLVVGMMSTDQVGCAGADTGCLRSRAGRCYEAWIGREPEIVIGTEAQQLAPVDLGPWAEHPVPRAPMAPEPRCLQRVETGDEIRKLHRLGDCSRSAAASQRVGRRPSFSNSA